MIAGSTGGMKQMIVLYHAWASTCSQKVRLCLAEKGLEHESRILNLRRFEQLSPEFLKLNPEGMVPVLVHDGFLIRESTVINDYLDEEFPVPALRPADARGRAVLGMWNRFIDEVPTAAVKIPSFQKNIRPVLQSYPPRELEAALARMPNRDNAARWRAAAHRETAPAELDAAHADLRRMLDRMESALGPAPGGTGGPWLAGEQFTLADINIAPFVDRTASFDEYRGFIAWPRVAAWHERLRRRPAFAIARLVAQTATLDQRG
jgi:glutathione S-transferase